MPFFKRKDSEDASTAAKTNGNGTATGKEKINYKARLEHKMYLVRSHFFQSEESTRRDVIVLEKKAVRRRPSAFSMCRSRQSSSSDGCPHKSYFPLDSSSLVKASKSLWHWFVEGYVNFRLTSSLQFDIFFGHTIKHLIYYENRCKLK